MPFSTPPAGNEDPRIPGDRLRRTVVVGCCMLHLLEHPMTARSEDSNDSNGTGLTIGAF
jgi:hypothetical protein